MTKPLAPQWLSDEARQHFEDLTSEIGAAADRASACAAKADASALRLELRLIALSSVSALETLKAMFEAEERANARQAA